MDKTECMARFDFFRRLPDAMRREAERAVSVIGVKRGEYVYQQGGECPLVALVDSGDVRVFRLSEAGREITLYHVTAGETCLVNLLCAYLRRPPPANAVAESDVTALVFAADRLRGWVRDLPAMQEYIFQRVSQRVVDLMVLVEDVAFRHLDERLAELLLRRAHDGVVKATHEQLAIELGAAREVVSRVLKHFERRGAATLGRGAIEIVDPAWLQAVSAGEPGACR